jgi:hypothetical protein
MGKLSFAYLSIALLAGSAGALAAETKSAAKSDAKPAAKVVGPPDVAWKEMTAAQKGKFMKDVVVPQMKVAFQEFDADEFKKFGCPTCHGDKGKANKFKMPAAELPSLPGSQAGFATLMEKKPKMMKFMGETVKPQMAKLLGLPEFDPKKPEAGGFSCGGCHTFKKE